MAAAGVPIASLLQYIAQNQGLNPTQAAQSDLPGSSGGFNITDLLPGGGGGPTSIPMGLGESLFGLGTANPLSIIGGLSSLGQGIASLFGGGRSSTGPGSATSDIAGAAGSSDPILALLGAGAGALGGNTPISSPAAGSNFGPYFNDARRLLDLVRWGPGGLTDRRAQALDATTLSNAMHELGNPGSGTSTLDAINRAFSGGSRYLTPSNLAAVTGGLNSNEQSLLGPIISQLIPNISNIPGLQQLITAQPSDGTPPPGDGKPGNSQQKDGQKNGQKDGQKDGQKWTPPPIKWPQPPRNPFQMPTQQLLSQAQLMPLLSLMSGGLNRGLTWIT